MPVCQTAQSQQIYHVRETSTSACFHKQISFPGRARQQAHTMRIAGSSKVMARRATMYYRITRWRTPFGKHEQGQEGEVLVRYQPAGCAVKGERGVVMPGMQRFEVRLVHSNDWHELRTAATHFSAFRLRGFAKFTASQLCVCCTVWNGNPALFAID